jgi:hypothetical protein
MIKYNNWLTLKNKNLDFNVEISNQIKINSKSYFDAIDFNARYVADTFPQPFDIFLSGGIDSELIVITNQNLGIKQNILIVEFENNINIKDVNEAKNICKNLGIPYKIIKINLKDWFENEAEDYYKKSHCSRIEYLPRLSWHKYSDNTMIMGGAEPYWRRELEQDYSQKSKWFLILTDHDFSLSLYDLSNRSNIIGEWYCMTPDITFTFHKEPLIQDLISDKLVGKISSYSSRIPLLRQKFTNIAPKPKLVGYEGAEGLPGSLPDFMESFKNNVMKESNSTTVKLTEEYLDSLIL